MSVVIETTLGDITVDLYVEERPRTCTNFLKLCKMKYYNLSLFHSVQRGFIAQTGDPDGNGRGGESVYGLLYGDQAKFYESEKVPIIKHSKSGLISMVNYGEQMLGSQFFLTLGEKLTYLDGEHCVFGEVTEGLGILEKLNEAICDEDNRPYQDIRITHTVILDDPFDDPKGLDPPSRSPSPTDEKLNSGRIRPDEAVDDTRTMEEVEEAIQEKDAKARATILEIIGDLPEADMAPPENVLFVCKLNPVTSDEDLEIIFSRFGKIKSCEVIKDQKSGESLQYAFIEFEDRKACEDAYFKMDNVLIDDRRIHVDFSQSVAKYKWKGKGRGVEIFEDKQTKPTSSTMPKSRPRAPWIRDPSASKSNHASDSDDDSPQQRGRKGQAHPEDEDNSKKHWSRSPPRYSRGHESTQKRKLEEEEQDADGEDTNNDNSNDTKLLKLLKKELKKQKKKKRKSKKKSGKKDKSDSSSSDGNSTD